MSRQRAEDEIRAGAWKLAAETTKQKAAEFLRRIAGEMDKALWDHNR